MFGLTKFSRKRMMLLGAVACAGSLALAAAATAQSAGGPPAAWRMFHHGPGGGHGSAMRGLFLAQRLAGLEIYLAITPEQQPQWRAFTAAMLAMVPAQAPSAPDAFAAIDQITARVEGMAQSAQHLHDASAALKAVLTPDQIGRADAIWASLQNRHGGMHGAWDHGGPDGHGPGVMPPAPAPKP